jgi:hypothetical protein
VVAEAAEAEAVEEPDELGVAPTPADCCCEGLPVPCSPELPMVPLLLLLFLWCVPPTTPPTMAPMTTSTTAMAMMIMFRRVRYHGTFATTGSWPFSAAVSSLRA